MVAEGQSGGTTMTVRQGFLASREEPQASRAMPEDLANQPV